MSNSVQTHGYPQGSGESSIPVPNEVRESALPQPDSTPTKSDERVTSTAIEARGGQRQDVISVGSRFAHDVHLYLQDLIRLADQKATLFFTGGTALLAFLYNSGVLMHWGRPLMEWNLVDIIRFAAAALMIVSVLAAIFVVVPTTRGSRRGFIFFEAITEFLSADKYANDLTCLDDKQVAREFATHSFELATICVQKYKWLRRSVVCGLCGIALALLLLIITGMMKPQ